MIAPTDADRAVARRVLRRIAGAPSSYKIGGGYSGKPPRIDRTWGNYVCCGPDVLAAAVEGAALGRLYRAALRGAS